MTLNDLLSSGHNVSGFSRREVHVCFNDVCNSSEVKLNQYDVSP